MLSRMLSNCSSQSAAKESEMVPGLEQERVFLLGSAENRMNLWQKKHFSLSLQQGCTT